MSLTLKTIECDLHEFNDVDVDKSGDDSIILKQDDDWIVLSQEMIQELGLFLTELDLD